MSTCTYLELAQELGLKVTDLRVFLEAHGLSCPPDVFDSRQRAQIFALFVEWCDRPRLIPLRLVAKHVGLDPDEYLKLAKNSGLVWLNTTNSRLTAVHAQALNEWLVSAGVLTSSPLDWPPPLENDVLTWMSTKGSFELNLTGSSDNCSPQINSEIEARIRTLAEEELAQEAKRLNYFLLRLFDRLTADDQIKEALSREGILLSSVQSALSTIPRMPKPRSGQTFRSDVFWAVVRSRRGNLSELWIENGDEPEARLVSKQREHPRRNRIKKTVDSRDAYHVGEIRWVQMHESRRGRRSELHHPAIIVEKSGTNKWWVLSLTTEIEESDESRRVPRHAEQGLEYAGFIWHELQKVFVSEIGEHIGWVHPELVSVIRRNITMRSSLIEELASVAAQKYSAG